MNRQPSNALPFAVPLAATGWLLAGAPARAGDTTPAVPKTPLEVGVLRNSDIAVVQEMLYTKARKSELGVHLGWMPFDAYTVTPVGGITFGHHSSETFGWEISARGGYSFKSATYKELEGPAYGIAPDAYRYLASALFNVQWSPIYAKMNWQGRHVIHHDVYGLCGLGATFEQAILPDHASALSPTLGIGVGTRIFTRAGIFRVQLTDEALREHRLKTAATQGWFLKQNVALAVGWSHLTGKGR